jgi:hypothetical protein
MPPHVRCAGPWVVASALLLGGATTGSAQNPDLILSKAARDSILATYDNIFPIWGRKAIERGFDLPYPVGLNVNLVWVSQELELSQLGLSTGENPTVPVDFIKFGQVKAPVFTANLRGDLWLFPFLNLYAFGGHAWVTTDVSVAEPVAFTTVVEQEGSYAGLGMTATMGIKRNWLAFDINWAWTQTEKLDHPVQGQIFGIRYGRAQPLRGTQRLAFWIGAMRQKLKSGTDGSILLSEVIDGGAADQLGTGLLGYQEKSWYQGLSTAERQAIDALAEPLLGGNLGNVTVNYSLQKSVQDPWNMILGASWDLSKRWQFRLETGFIGRVQVLAMSNYRFNW